jgi:hypothetical protein
MASQTFRLLIVLSAILTMPGMHAGSRADQTGSQYCRLDHASWLGCPGSASVPIGAKCTCPTVQPDDAKRLGHVGPSRDEDVFVIASDSSKLALGLSWFSGPVTLFVPRTLITNRGVAPTGEQQQILQLYDFVRFHNQASRPAAPSTAAVQPPPAIPSIETRLTPARIFLRAADIPPAAVGAYGVAALKARPTEASRARLGMVCAAFLASLPAQQDLPPQIPLARQMLTVWPYDSSEGLTPSRADCKLLLDHYDLFGGQSAIADAELQGRDLGGRGPFLIGWSPSNTRGVRDAVVLVVDLSEFDTQSSFDEAFLFWQKEIVEDPALWESGFSVQGLRLAARDFVDRYGSDILRALKFGGR